MKAPALILFKNRSSLGVRFAGLTLPIICHGNITGRAKLRLSRRSFSAESRLVQQLRCVVKNCGEPRPQMSLVP